MTTAEKIITAESYMTKVLDLAEEARRELDEMKRECMDVKLTQPQAARILGVSRRTIGRMLEDGRLESTYFTDVQKRYKKTRRANAGLN